MLSLLKNPIMETMSVGEFKSKFSEVLKKVLAGEEIAISYGKSKEIVARLVPRMPSKKQRRKIGIFEGKGSVSFDKNFKMTEKDFLGL
jgi:antitoxin (DNA-binding transcriptional repressor) of toxin-antitoxin stability system